LTLKERLEQDMKAALRAKDAPRLNCIRMLRSQLQAREVALRAERGRDYQLEETEAQAAIAAYAKQRRDSIESYRAGGREELAVAEEQELAIVGEYLPRQLAEPELREVVRQVIAESGLRTQKDMGAVMRQVLGRVKGAADGALVNRIVREFLE
jgi:uncharacterized protein YqeY